MLIPALPRLVQPNNNRINIERRPTPALADTPVVFDLDNVEVFYGALRAVRGVSMRVYDKQITAFIGPSGCGKTTMLRAFNPSLFSEANTALSVQIFGNATSSFVAAQDRAWGAAFTLVTLTFLVTFIARVVTARFALKR